MADLPLIEVRGFKWPRRPIGTAHARLLGEDAFGRWLGLTQGDPWWRADGSPAGAFETSFVKLVPHHTFWTACFHPMDPVVDVDIVLPVQWNDEVLEEGDLELDILRFADGTMQVRDHDVFAQVRQTWAMPADVATQAETTCRQVQTLVARASEPFGTVGSEWLARFLAHPHSPRFR